MANYIPCMGPGKDPWHWHTLEKLASGYNLSRNPSSTLVKALLLQPTCCKLNGTFQRAYRSKASDCALVESRQP
eukprot:3651208-Amphidinium_carterae.2